MPDDRIALRRDPSAMSSSRLVPICRTFRHVGTWLVLCVAVLAGASIASASARLTATGVRLGDHPAYVCAVIDFAGGTLNDDEVRVTHFTSTAATVEVVHPKPQTQAAPGSGYGMKVRVVKDTGRLRVEIGFARGRIEYVMFAVVTP